MTAGNHAVMVVHALRFTAVPFTAECVAELGNVTVAQAGAAIRHGLGTGWITPADRPESWVGAHRSEVR